MYSTVRAIAKASGRVADQATRDEYEEVSYNHYYRCYMSLLLSSSIYTHITLHTFIFHTLLLLPLSLLSLQLEMSQSLRSYQ